MTKRTGRGRRIPHTHGEFVGGKASPELLAWYRMKDRCRNPNVRAWKLYGGRGIKVCDRWQEFANFLADMGRRPPGTSLDRIDCDGNYEPGNCRWATTLEQVRNRRVVKMTQESADELRAKYVAGEHPKELAAMYGIARNVVRHIITNRTWKTEHGFVADSICATFARRIGHVPR